jgi:hypothetical protein
MRFPYIAFSALALAVLFAPAARAWTIDGQSGNNSDGRFAAMTRTFLGRQPLSLTQLAPAVHD